MAGGEIKITISKTDGSMTTEGMGYAGNACTKDTEELLKSLKASTISRRAKTEVVRRVGRVNAKR